jgi:hypothetical protein
MCDRRSLRCRIFAFETCRPRSQDWRRRCAGARPSGDGRKQIYALTKKGIDLAPILIGLMTWASKYERTSMPPALKRRVQEEPDKLIAEIAQHWSNSRR